jgi:hypothetical protein
MANRGIPDDVIFIDSLLSLCGRPDFHFDSEPREQNMSSSETESTASDLSHEQELGEVGEGGEKSTKALICNHISLKINYLAPMLTRECPSHAIAMPSATR